MKIRTILPLALVLALLTGCAEDEADFGGRQADGAGEPVALSIAPESVTRAVTFAGDAWEGGEEVAVSIGGVVKKYVVGADKTTLSPATDVTPFYWTASTMDIEAWYPYADEKPAVTVPADQSTEDKFRAAIMLEASVTDAPFGPVALTFTHRTVKVVVMLHDDNGYLIGVDADLVLLTNLSGVSNGTTVKTYMREHLMGSGIYEFFALVAPQTIAANTSLVTFCKGGDVWTYKYSAAVNLQAGGKQFIDPHYNSATRPNINGHKYVLMGDGLKWATCNVGAQNPMDYGDYFQWGETTTKSNYDWVTYTFNPSGDGKTFTKYTSTSDVLEMSDDAARQNWGSTWRMPTKAEVQALKNTTNFTWTWTTNYLGTGVRGMIVTSKVSGYVGNSIFLPASGYANYTNTGGVGTEGNYWTVNICNSLGYPNSLKYAQALWFSSGTGYAPLLTNAERCVGYSIRPVSN